MRRVISSLSFSLSCAYSTRFFFVNLYDYSIVIPFFLKTDDINLAINLMYYDKYGTIAVSYVYGITVSLSLHSININLLNFRKKI